MSAKPIDIFAELRVHAPPGGRAPERMAIVFEAPTLQLTPDDKAIAAIAAKAIEESIRENLLAGRAPGGEALPPVSASTMERRAYREKQAARAGQLDEHVKDEKNRRDGLKNWKRRFQAAKLGMVTPGGSLPRGLWGVESGLLAKSVKAVPDAGGWKVFFAGIRANLDRSGRSAVTRVFRRIGVWSQTAMKQTKIQDALRKVARGLWVRRAGDLGELLQAAGGLAAAAADQGE